MPTIEQFAQAHRLRVQRDSCGESVITGKPRTAPRPESRSHVYDNGDGSFGVCLLFNSVGKWRNAAKRLMSVGATLKQNGDTEGTLLFDPSDKAQVKAAIREAGIKVRRTLTPEQAAAARLCLSAVRPERSL